MIKSEQRAAIKEVINSNFTFADLSRRFIGVDESSGNIYCPFHENHDTPASKMYWDEERNLWILHCFGECHTNYTAYDYVNLILCEKYQKYRSPLDFLKSKFDDNTLKILLKKSENKVTKSSSSFMKDKIKFIDNIFDECGNITDFIENLYTM